MNHMYKLAVLSTLLMALAGLGAQPVAAQASWANQRDDETVRIFRLLGKNAVWTKVDQIRVDFPTFHTQGLVKIGDTFYVSAVEILEATVRDQSVSTDSTYDFSIDRTAGAGRGWLFKFDSAGKLQAKVELSEGSVFHPGGIDFDGTYLWVPVAEYRPNSQANIFRVDPQTLKAEKVLSEKDHIGGVMHDPVRGKLHGVSWGSRRLYTWKQAEKGDGIEWKVWIPNAANYIDYQDCHFHGDAYALCGGVGSYATPLGNVAFGGVELVDLWWNKQDHLLPVNLFVDEGKGPSPTLAATNNAFWVEPKDGKLRFYFMTESNNQADLLIYDATPWIDR